MSDHDHDHDIPPLPQHLIDEAAAGCEESRFLINRRSLLGMSGAFFAWAYMPRHAEAAGTEPRLLIVLLGGGMDGLHVAPPLNDPHYAGLRGDIAFGKNQLLALTSDFGLNPRMPNFKSMFEAGDAAMVQAIAPPLRRRSHFEEADVTYINDRNAHFNKKLQRFFGEYTQDIRENLERGTAL